MLELGAGAGLLRAFGWLLWGILAMALLAALIKPKTGTGKALCVLLVLVIFFGPMLPNVYQTFEHKQKYAKAKALFDERCKTAGENIYRTVDNVEGVLLINLRPDKVSRDDQFERYDPYGYYGGGDEYIKSYLPGYWALCIGASTGCSPRKRAFNFIEVQSEKNSIKQYKTVDRQTGKPLLPKAITTTQLTAETVTYAQAQYGVRWEDISSDADRQAWIAGGRLTIIELKTKTVIAERTGYLLDPRQGSTDGSRSPWAWARRYGESCPNADEHNALFVRKVLKPIKGE